MAEPLTVSERRRRAAERAGADAILLAGPLLGLVLFALTGAWPWLVVGAVLLPIARLAARRVGRGRPPRTFAEALLSPRGWHASGRDSDDTTRRMSATDRTTRLPRGEREPEMSGQPMSAEAIRVAVRERYVAAAEQATGGGASRCGPAESSCCGTSAVAEPEREVFGASQYGEGERAALPAAAQLASLGCGNPTAVAELREGEAVLDLGSGGGIDVLLSARRVGPSGFAYGLDMTDAMLALARRNAAEAGAGNVEFLRGEIEAIPLADAAVDVVISNCVVNLSADKARVLREVARVLRPGGRLGMTDVVADLDMDDATRRDMQAFTGCIAGALTREQYEVGLRAAGLVDVEVRETHRVHTKAGSAIIRARKPEVDAGSCCAPVQQETCCAPAAKADCCGVAASGSSCDCR